MIITITYYISYNVLKCFKVINIADNVLVLVPLEEP